jgi:hypothetical protein
VFGATRKNRKRGLTAAFLCRGPLDKKDTLDKKGEK